MAVEKIASSVPKTWAEMSWTERTKMPWADIWDAGAPKALQTNGSYGYYVKKVHSIVGFGKDFIVYNYNWLRDPTGAKSLLIKIPEAIVKISDRYSLSTSLSVRPFHFFAHYMKPIKGLGYAKPFLAIMDSRSKIDYIVKPRTEIKYLLVDQKGVTEETFVFTPFEWYVNLAGSFAEWVISVGETESFLHAAYGWTRRPLVTPIARFASPVISLKTIYLEGSFLYKTIILRQMHGAKIAVLAEEKTAAAAAAEKTIPKEVIIGSLLKVALCVVCLSLDVFNNLAARESKPFWLTPATIFWTRLAPTFMIPAAFYYWPKLVVEPLKSIKPKTS